MKKRLFTLAPAIVLLWSCAAPEPRPRARQEGPAPAISAPSPTKPRVKLGQTRAEVWAIYGRPYDVVRGRSLEVWSYENGSDFDFSGDKLVRLPETFPPVAKNPGAFPQPTPDDAPGMVDLGASSSGPTAPERAPGYPSRRATLVRQRGPLDMSRPVPVREHQRTLKSGRVVTVRSHTRSR